MGIKQVYKDNLRKLPNEYGESEFVKIIDGLSSRTENSSADIQNHSSDKISAGHRKVEDSS